MFGMNLVIVAVAHLRLHADSADSMGSVSPKLTLLLRTTMVILEFRERQSEIEVNMAVRLPSRRCGFNLLCLV